MPAQPFSVHVDLDELAERNLTAALKGGSAAKTSGSDESGLAHHGTRDGREAARRQSGRAHADRAAGAAGGRSYAFRRS